MSPKYRKPNQSYSRRRKKRQQDLNKAKRSFASRSPRSRAMDLARNATPAPSIEVYVKYPNRFDWVNVDVPGADKKANAKALSKLARKKPVDLVVRRKPTRTQSDPQPQRFQVRRKPKKPTHEEANALTPEVAAPPQQTKPKNRLPTKPEILERATEMALEQQARLGLEPITPEESELKESGLFERARAELMRGDATIIDPMVQQYVDELRAELEPQGFTIVPISAEAAAAAAAQEW